MGKVKKFSAVSLKWCFLLYLPFCIIVSFFGSFGIGVAANCMQDWYENKHPDVLGNEGSRTYVISFDEGKIGKYKNENDELVPVSGYEKRVEIIYMIISYGQGVLIALWVMICLAGTGVVFYNRELKKPFGILKSASDSISQNKLDFSINYPRKNELGKLCESFEQMRKSLYDSNLKMWRSLDERKRLNSAFSHDLRTPLTVLRGYTDYLCRYIPEGKVSEEKLLSTLDTMNGHISRLEHYVEGMNSVQKLEDLEPSYTQVTLSSLNKSLSETAEIISGEKEAELRLISEELFFSADSDVIMQVYENLISNAYRYAVSRVTVTEHITGEDLILKVMDDGPGFSENAEVHCTDPFFRDDKETDKSHFGLGLYICRILCEKHSGTIRISNNKTGGGCVEAVFGINFKKI
ncbi:MAG: HAMP domain-containing sensor histidine kinase [Oscillospiraceae bacterium]|nr:HAMP domain-containing sensor histidine kinase [Oscillospiraceae bacterium]